MSHFHLSPIFLLIIKLGRKREMVPDIAHILGTLGRTRSIPLEKRGMIRRLPPKYRESGKTKSCAFRRQSRFHHFCRLSLDLLVKPVSTQSQALWDPSTALADRRLLPVHHGCHWAPQPPLDASIDGGGAQDRPTPGRACWGSVGLVLSYPGVRWRTFIRDVLQERYTCLTRAPHLQGGSGTGYGAPRPAGG